jgi:hypothetical protein
LGNDVSRLSFLLDADGGLHDGLAELDTHRVACEAKDEFLNVLE